MKRDRKELEETLIEPISKIKKSKKVVEDIKKHLADKYQIVDTQLWINNVEELSNLDIRELLLFTEQIFLKTGDLSVNVETFFTPSEISEARQYSALTFDETIELPYTIPNVLQLSNEEYVCILEASEINKLMKSNILNYNLDIQREAKVIKRKNKVILTPTINQKSVKEITKNLLEGKQFTSELKFNASVGSAESGDELVYNPKTLELTITKNSRVDILDGMHRIQGILNAFTIDPDIKQKFTISISNYSTRRAQLAQSQIAKFNKFSAQRIQELEQSRFSDIIVKQIRDESDLKISQTNRVAGNHLVSYNVLADTIDEEFDIKNRAQAADIGEFLSDYFNFLLGDISDNIDEIKKVSLVVENSMFVGYVVLAKRMIDEGMKAKEIRKIIKTLDFNRANPLWQEIGVLNPNGNLTETNKSRKAIKNYFEELEIGVQLN